MALKKKIERLAAEKAPGPSPAFSVFDLIRALELISAGPVGRGKLSRELGIGEGSARTLIRRLREAGLTATAKAGCSLTRSGEELWGSFKSAFPKKAFLGKNELTPAACSVAILARRGGGRVTAGMEQRDAAIAVGTRWVTTLVLRGGKLIIPTVSEDVERDYPKAFQQIVGALGPEEGDAVVVASADTPRKAEYGALAAVWTLLEDDC